MSPSILVKSAIEQLVEPGRAAVGLEVTLHHLAIHHHLVHELLGHALQPAPLERGPGAQTDDRAMGSRRSLKPRKDPVILHSDRGMQFMRNEYHQFLLG